MEEEKIAYKYEKLLESVIQMRKYQKAYFKDRRQDDLRASKDFEKRVDELIQTVPASNQIKLF